MRRGQCDEYAPHTVIVRGGLAYLDEGPQMGTSLRLVQLWGVINTLRREGVWEERNKGAAWRRLARHA